MADQTAEEEEGGQGVDDPAESDVVAVRPAQPEETARGQPRPAQHLEAEIAVEVEQQGIQREEGNGVAPQVLEVAMKQGHGQDAGHSVRLQWTVAEASEFESELLIDQEDPPDDHQNAEGDGEDQTNQGTVGRKGGRIGKSARRARWSSCTSPGPRATCNLDRIRSPLAAGRGGRAGGGRSPPILRGRG